MLPPPLVRATISAMTQTFHGLDESAPFPSPETELIFQTVQHKHLITHKSFEFNIKVSQLKLQNQF
jgi:hypothetical protein